LQLSPYSCCASFKLSGPLIFVRILHPLLILQVLLF
jgi:hypothetical protein